MPIPTEPIGSIPRTTDLLAAMRAHAGGGISAEQLKTAEESALRDTIARLEETGSPVITDGEQTKPSFVTYPLPGAIWHPMEWLSSLPTDTRGNSLG